MDILRWTGVVLLWLFLIVLPIRAEWSPSFEQQAGGESFRCDSFSTYLRPADFLAGGKAQFNVRVNGKFTGVYNDLNAWGKQVSFAYFSMKPGTEVQVEITCLNDFHACFALPGEHRPLFAEEDGTLCVTMKAGESLSLIFDKDYQGETLHLFANSLEECLPSPSSGLIVFGPGYHKLTEPLVLHGNKQVYIAGGAVVEGTLQIEQADGARVYGSGMWVKRDPGGVVVSCAFSRNVSMEGILVHNRRLSGWTVALHCVDGFRADNLRVISTHYASTDGFDIVNSRDVHLSHLFIRSCDDAIAVKGLVSGKPASCPPNEHMTFEHLQLWNDCNNAMCLGAETRAACYRDIHFRDIDVLYSYDDRDHHTQLDERSVMNIVCLNGTYFENISYENIRVNQCERLVGITFKDSFWFGTLKGDQSTPGGVRNVTYKDITSRSERLSSITNGILLNGWHREGTPDKLIENVTFQRVKLGGRKLAGKDIQTNNTRGMKLVKNIRICR